MSGGNDPKGVEHSGRHTDVRPVVERDVGYERRAVGSKPQRLHARPLRAVRDPMGIALVKAAWAHVAVELASHDVGSGRQDARH